MNYLFFCSCLLLSGPDFSIQEYFIKIATITKKYGDKNFTKTASLVYWYLVGMIFFQLPFSVGSKRDVRIDSTDFIFKITALYHNFRYEIIITVIILISLFTEGDFVLVAQ